jgi:hypothetical protein
MAMSDENEKPGGVAEDGKPVIDDRVFTRLFLHPKKHRELIWREMARIVHYVAASHIQTPVAADLEEMKGEALVVAMEVVDKGGYDPARGSAYNYFYAIVKNHLWKLSERVNRRRTREGLLGEDDAQICFDQLSTIQPIDAAAYARQHSPNNWKTFRLHDARDRYNTERFLRVSLKMARIELQAMKRAEEESGGGRGRKKSGQRAAARVIIQTLRQVERALLG